MNWIVKLIVGIAAIGLLGLTAHSLFDKFQSGWERRVQRVEAVVEVERARADALEREAVADSVRLDELATRLAVEKANIKERIRIVRETVVVPDTCQVFVAQRDSIIDDLEYQIERRDGQVTEYQAAFNKLRIAYTSLEISVDSLQAVLSDRPIPLPKWIPSVSVGAFAGVCATGQPCIGVGIGVTWDIRLPF